MATQPSSASPSQPEVDTGGVITAPLPPSRQAQRDRAGNTVRSTVPLPEVRELTGAEFAPDWPGGVFDFGLWLKGFREVGMMWELRDL